MCTSFWITKAGDSVGKNSAVKSLQLAESSAEIIFFLLRLYSGVTLRGRQDKGNIYSPAESPHPMCTAFRIQKAGDSEGTTNYQLSTVNYQLSTINCQLSTVNYQLSTVNCQLSTLSRNDLAHKSSRIIICN